MPSFSNTFRCGPRGDVETVRQPHRTGSCRQPARQLQADRIGQGAGRAISRDVSQLSAVTLKLEVNPTIAVTTKEMVARLNDPNVQILDVRTPQEFIGEDIRAIRGGHIPGAINIPYEQNWVDPETPAKLARKQVTNNAGMSLKPAEELKRLYAKFDPSKETIVYCQSGARASETAGVLQHLGFTNVKVYDSAWLGYGNTLDAPANNVTFFNVELLNSRLLALQDRVNQLEKNSPRRKRENNPQRSSASKGREGPFEAHLLPSRAPPMTV